MGFEIFLSLLLIVSYHLEYGDCGTTLSIKDFLSDPNKANYEDHSEAFQAAWKALCEGKGTSLVINTKEQYTIQPQLLKGPCVSPNLHIQIDGILEAPKTVKGWGDKRVESWLFFEGVTGLVLDGSGLLNLNGEIWWSSVAFSSRPQAVRFNNCKDIIYSGLTQRDSPRSHISIDNSVNATLSNFHIIAPANSPNTDGIDISRSHNINIISSSIETGDDCIAINGGSYDINVTNVACGPGHGISVGSLGKGGENDIVKNVKVRHCTFNGSKNGARIKTWAGGQGFARNILYENITLINAGLPIVIDQQYIDKQYCNGQHNCNNRQANAVKVSDVTFKDFTGTSADSIAIKIICDQKVNCDNIVLEHIDIMSSTPNKPLRAICQYANVATHLVSVHLNCGSYGPQPPSPSPQPLTPELSPIPQVQPPAPYAPPPTPFAKPPAPYDQPPSPQAQSPTPVAKTHAPDAESPSPHGQRLSQLAEPPIPHVLPPTPLVQPHASHSKTPAMRAKPPYLFDLLYFI